MTITPTSRGWGIAVVAIIWLLVARINHNLVALILAWSSVALLATGFLFALFSLHRLEIKRLPPSPAYVGRLFNLPLLLINRCRCQRQSFAIIEKLAFAPSRRLVTVVPPLRSCEEYTLDRKLVPTARGVFSLGKIIVRSADPMGIFYRERKLNLPESAVVYPPYEPLDSLELQILDSMPTSTGSAPVSAAGHSQDFYSIREYTPSDGMRYIHWKSTARFHKLMVREFERSAQLTVALLVDGQAGPTSPAKPALHLEASLILAASVCQYLKTVPCHLAVGLGGKSPALLPPKPIQDIIGDAMLAFATMQSGEQPLSSVLEEMVQILPPHTIVYCFSLEETEQLGNELQELQARGFDIRWFNAAANAFQPKKHKHTLPPRPRPTAFRARQVFPSTTLTQVLKP